MRVLMFLVTAVALALATTGGVGAQTAEPFVFAAGSYEQPEGLASPLGEGTVQFFLWLRGGSPDQPANGAVLLRGSEGLFTLVLPCLTVSGDRALVQGFLADFPVSGPVPTRRFVSILLEDGAVDRALAAQVKIQACADPEVFPLEPVELTRGTVVVRGG